MILYEDAPQPIVRLGEQDLAGRRLVARTVCYAGEAGRPRWRFDPIERRFQARSAEGVLRVGPFDPEPWVLTLSRGPSGGVAVGPGDPAEPVRGALQAAATGAALAGRGVYLLDPSEATLPDPDGSVFVVVFSVAPGARCPQALKTSARRGLAAGVLLPLIPGWTVEPEALARTVEEAARCGSRFAAPVVAADDGTARRAIVQAREEIDARCPDDFFERIHHADWEGEVEQGRQAIRAACSRLGLASLPARAVGRGQSIGNAGAAGRLEERADALAGRDEHHASLLHAAARWIDESDWDLGPIVREGNFRRVFPFAGEVARETEEAIRGTS